MAEIYDLVLLQQVLTANGTGSPSYTVPSNETLTIREVRKTSTGTFQITGIRDSGSRFYTNASAAVPLPSEYFQDVKSPNIGNTELNPPIEIAGGATFYFDIKDTSGAGNTVSIMLECTRHTTEG